MDNIIIIITFQFMHYFHSTVQFMNPAIRVSVKCNSFLFCECLYTIYILICRARSVVVLMIELAVLYMYKLLTYVVQAIKWLLVNNY